MKQVVRDMLSSNIGAAVRLLAECHGLADTKPTDIAQFVSDDSSVVPGVGAADGDRIVGLVAGAYGRR